jgi:hypothetical protein
MILGKITRKNGQTWATIYPEGDETYIMLQIPNIEVESIEVKGNNIVVKVEK